MTVNRPARLASPTRVTEPREGALVIEGESLSQALSDACRWSRRISLARVARATAIALDLAFISGPSEGQPTRLP